MKLIRIPSLEEVAKPLQSRLIQELQSGSKVLWLVPGGSNIPLSVGVMNMISDDLSRNLTIYLTDERYGEVDHADSNTRQLREAGFDPKSARMVDVLAWDLSLEETSEQYALSIRTAFEAADVVIAQMGVGPDGHICGILPGTPAAESSELVTGYQTETFTRITLTPKALIENVEVAYVFAFGEAKLEALQNLQKNLSLAEQPAQLLKKLPEAYVYNDQIEGDVS